MNGSKDAIDSKGISSSQMAVFQQKVCVCADSCFLSKLELLARKYDTMYENDITIIN